MFRFLYLRKRACSIAIVGVELLFSFDHTGGTFDINHNYID